MSYYLPVVLKQGELPPDLARLVSKAKARMLDLKVNYKHKNSNNLTCPFCCEYDETFGYIFNCGSGVRDFEGVKKSNITF